MRKATDAVTDRYSNGRCWALAWALHKMTGWPIRAVAEPGSTPGQGIGWVHVVVERPDGMLVDIHGAADFDAVMDRFEPRLDNTEDDGELIPVAPGAFQQMLGQDPVEVDADDRSTAADVLARLGERDTAQRAMLGCATWTGHCYESEEDDNPEPLDSWVDVDDLPADVVQSLTEDLNGFLNDVETECTVDDMARLDAEQVGHDFHLTRNHHGAGFWDRGHGDLGSQLTTLAQAYGHADVQGHRDQDGNITSVWL